jgi:hypothetical protein
MHGTFKRNTPFPNGKYKVVYGITHEFGMGGPYASSIYLRPKNQAPIFISGMCYGEAVIADDESCFYFLFLNINRNLQVMQFDLESSALKLFKDVYGFAEFESTKTKYAYSVNAKNWIEAENRYNEGLIICDTNEINVQSKTLIELK